MAIGNRQVLPVLGSITPTEIISDPFVRELYFGSPDTPGLIRQATDAAQKALLDQPAFLRETARLTPDEIRAREIARAGIGSFLPFLRTAQESFGQGLGALQGSIGFGGPSARQLLRGSLRGFDPSMTGQFFNPFEEQVVQQTIDDTLRAAAQQDIAQRASDIARGGQSAFGSRARLTAEERQRGLGRGLGEVLSRIRSGGFLTAQDRALQELQRQRDAARQAASLEQGFGQDLSAAQRLFGSDIADLGATQQRLRGIDIANLTGLGATERGIEEQRLAREFAQQQAQRQAPLQATKFIQGFAIDFKQDSTAGHGLFLMNAGIEFVKEDGTVQRWGSYDRSRQGDYATHTVEYKFGSEQSAMAAGNARFHRFICRVSSQGGTGSRLTHLTLGNFRLLWDNTGSNNGRWIVPSLRRVGDMHSPDILTK